ncbi:MAG: HD domain-containing protein [Candidatus Liptonbacteria bacterium]|nr:HD domain-containing protein [Candidatus Liptonbacteria bacterium]
MNREEFFELLKSKISQPGLDLVQDAYNLAKNLHRDQMRDDGERYFEHCRRVALVIILERKIFQPETIATALLHDVLEDTFVHPRVLRKVFGEEIHGWLNLLSKTVPRFDDMTGKVVFREKKGLQNYFWAIQNGPLPVRIIKLSDRLDNLRSFSIWPSERRAKYIRETKGYIFPIAQDTDSWFIGEFSKHCGAA